LLRFHFKDVFKYGKNIADGVNLSKSFGDNQILNDCNFEILSGQKIGLIGPNGCGKTTFINMLTGVEKPDSGILNISRGARWGYFDQRQLSLDLDNTLIEEILRKQKDLKETDAKALLGQFNFRGSIIYNQIGKLSGGERARLAFLKLIMQPYNFLILDEPTNHMDLESKMAIEGALNSFSGTVIAISHDRRFLDNVTDTTFLMTNTSIKTYKGNYTASRLQHQKELLKKPEVRLKDMPGGNLKKYVVKKSFTDWTNRRKYKIGEEILIGDHNFKLYEWAINSSRLKCLRRKK
jgi:ATP-binding cassette subfamily F protein 3